MPKRACPFEDNCAPQMKVHVSTADINKRNVSNLEAIHEKTINKLFQGANNNKRTPVKQSAKEDVNYRQCTECRQPAEIVSHCWFCEVNLCQRCLNICTYCSENFCSRCTVAIYKRGNNFTCFTCYN